MRPQVITVHNIHDAINTAGVEPYANTLVQDMGGGYYFVDAYFNEGPPVNDGSYVFGITRKTFGIDDFYPDGTQKTEEIEERWFYKIIPVPLKLAYFIIETLRLKAQFTRLGVGNIDEPVKQAVYMLPGSTIFGQAIETLTEIPAEMRPVVVERL